jgi:hypothetical protein
MVPQMGFSRWHGRTPEPRALASPKGMGLYPPEKTWVSLYFRVQRAEVVRASTRTGIFLRRAAAPRLDVAELLHQLFVPFPPLEILRGEQHLSPGHVHGCLV